GQVFPLHQSLETTKEHVGADRAMPGALLNNHLVSALGSPPRIPQPPAGQATKNPPLFQRRVFMGLVRGCPPWPKALYTRGWEASTGKPLQTYSWPSIKMQCRSLVSLSMNKTAM